MHASTQVDLKNRFALVTGGSRGIGRAIAVKLASAGACVAINFLRNRTAAEEVAEEIRRVGPEPLLLRANVAEEEHRQRMFEELKKEFGALDILVSNAASGVLKPSAEISPKHFAWTFAINAQSFLHLVQQAAPLMEGRRGRIFAVSSLGAVRAIPYYAAVGASKGALESLVRHLAVELAPKGITVNVISPGVVDTDALRHFPNRAEMVRWAEERTPAGHLVSPEDVADVVLLLSSELSRMIVGQTIIVDGGYSVIAWP